MHLLSLTGLLPVCLLASGIASQTPIVTEADLLLRLDDEHPAVLVAAHDLRLAEAEVLSRTTFANPNVDYSREDLSSGSVESQWQLRWQLPDSNRRLLIEAGEKKQGASRARLDYELRELRWRLRAIYARWAIQDAKNLLFDAQAARLEALAERETRRVLKGESSGLEARRLGLRAADARAKLALGTDQQLQILADLRQLLPDLSPAARPTLPPLPPPATSLDPEDNHALLTAGRLELEAARLELEAARRFMPTPELGVGFKREEDGFSSNDGVTFGVSWSIPLFDRHQGRRAAAGARIELARGLAELAAQEISARRGAVAARYQGLHEELSGRETARKESVDLLQNAEQAFRYGELPLTDFLDIQSSLTGSELARLELYAAALEAHRELELFTQIAQDPNISKKVENP